VCGALVFATPAAAWVSQTLFSPASYYGQGVALAGNARGAAAAVFPSGHGLRLAFARPGRPFGRSRFIPGSQGGRYARVAIDASDNVLVTWSYFDETDPAPPSSRDEGCCNSARMTVRTAGSGHLRRVQNLAPEGHDVFIGAASIANGRVAVAWQQGGRIRARFAPRGRRLERAGSVTAPGAALAVTPSRRGAAVTYNTYLTGSAAIREFQLGRSGRVSRPRTVLGGLPEFPYITFASNAHGDQVALWSADSSARYAALRRRGGRFRVRKVGGGGGYGITAVSISPGGDSAMVAWARSKGIRIATGRPGRRIGAARTIATPAGGAGGLGVAVNDSGRAVLEWDQYRDDGSYQLLAAFRSPKGRLRGRHTLSTRYALSPYAAIDARGRARVTWAGYDSVFAALGSYP
jgi:hypothetical protein